MARTPTATFALTIPTGRLPRQSRLVPSVPRQSRLVPSVPRQSRKRRSEDAYGQLTAVNFIRNAATARQRRMARTDQWFSSGHTASLNEAVTSPWAIKAPAALHPASTEHRLKPAGAYVSPLPPKQPWRPNTTTSFVFHPTHRSDATRIRTPGTGSLTLACTSAQGRDEHSPAELVDGRPCLRIWRC